MRLAKRDGIELPFEAQLISTTFVRRGYCNQSIVRSPEGRITVTLENTPGKKEYDCIEAMARTALEAFRDCENAYQDSITST